MGLSSFNRMRREAAQKNAEQMPNLDYSKLSVKDLREHLTKAGIEFPSGASKDDLVTLAQPKQDT